MNLREFSQINRERCESPQGFNHQLDSWSIAEWFVALFGELGEAANISKKLNRIRDGIPGNKETKEELEAKLAKEMADAYVYFDLLVQAADFDLPTAVLDVFNNKSQEIGYPVRVVEDNGELELVHLEKQS